MSHERTQARMAGKWLLERELGRGAAGAVYQARGPGGGSVAVKLLDPALAASDAALRRFAREARVATLLDHPVAVPVIETGITRAGEPFLVMEYLDGLDLERHAASRPASIGDALIVADRILDLLRHAHGLGILHRDLKPGNVFVERSGAVRVLDFGVARLRNPDESVLTRVGVPIGTPGYMSPEQARGESRVDARSDLWSVGAILFFLLARRPIRCELGELAEIAFAASTPAPPLLLAAPSLDPALGELVDRALAFEPDARFQSAYQMQAAVREAYERVVDKPLPNLEADTVVDLELPTLRRVPDRRRHQRMSGAFAVGLHARRGVRVGLCRSYSREGILIASPSRFATGESLEIELPASWAGATRLRARGRVMRVTSDRLAGLFSEQTAIALEQPFPLAAHQRIVATLNDGEVEEGETLTRVWKTREASPPTCGRAEPRGPVPVSSGSGGW
jgi:serine/threonine protein kinase